MKKIASTIIALCLVLSLAAQEETTPDTLWKINGVTSLNLSQLSLTNWAAGGDNSIAGNALVQVSADYDNGDLQWDNDLTLGFGMIRQGSDPARKSDDQIDFSSKLGYKASENWNYTGQLSYNTQFAPGYDKPGETDRTKISNFMAPGYFTLSAGMDYKPNEGFSLFLSPVTGKITFVMDEDLSNAGSFGLDAGETVRTEFGGYIKIAYKKEILKNVLLDTKIDLFSNYLENPQYVDVNWDLLLTFTVNEYISATLMTQLIYDHDIEFAFDSNNDGVNDSAEPRVQFKELFGLGLTYTF
jgi:opacity protein-like surface antigen